MKASKAKKANEAIIAWLSKNIGTFFVWPILKLLHLCSACQCTIKVAWLSKVDIAAWQPPWAKVPSLLVKCIAWKVTSKAKWPQQRPSKGKKDLIDYSSNLRALSKGHTRSILTVLQWIKYRSGQKSFIGTIGTIAGRTTTAMRENIMKREAAFFMGA